MGNGSQNEAGTALHINISAKLSHPLPYCTMIEKECKFIMYLAIRATLYQTGIAASPTIKLGMVLTLVVEQVFILVLFPRLLIYF